MNTRPHVALMISLALFGVVAFARFAQVEGMVDVHVHLYGPYRGPSGGPPTMPKERGGKPEEGRQLIDFEARAKVLVAKMDTLGVDKAIVMSPPRAADAPMRPLYIQLKKIASEHPGRLYFLGGGDVLNPIIQRTAPDKVSDGDRKEFEAKAKEVLASGAKGFGEMAGLHLSMEEGHPFEQTLPDYPLFLVLAEVAGRRKATIDLHMDAIEVEKEIPSSLARLRALNPGALKANIPALEKLLAHDRKARVVWQHAGSDPLEGMTPRLLRRLLTAHPNLYVALRPEKVELGPVPVLKNGFLDKDGKVLADWLALFTDFSDRFMIGSDLFVPESVDAPAWKPMMESLTLLAKLPPELARKLGHDNAVKIYNLE